MLLFASLILLCASRSFAAPGAHGPNGEHLDIPAGHVANADSQPQFETMSEHLEITGHLHADGLYLYLNLFDSSAPVLDETTEVEVQLLLPTGDITAAAALDAGLGAYVVRDMALLTALQAAGEHALMLTIIGPENSSYGSDLLEAKLHVPESDAEAVASNAWLARVPLSFWLTSFALLVLRLGFDIQRWNKQRLPKAPV